MRIGLRELVLLVVLVAVPVASFFLVFKPQNDAIDAAKAEVAHKQSMLDELRKETSQTDDLLKENEALERRIERVEARLPSNNELDRVIRQVSQLAVAAGLEPPALKNAKPLGAALYMEQPLEMKTKGNFGGYYTFLQRLEQLPRITRIPDMKVQRDMQMDGLMNIEFTLSIYYQPEGQP